MDAIVGICNPVQELVLYAFAICYDESMTSGQDRRTPMVEPYRLPHPQGTLLYTCSGLFQCTIFFQDKPNPILRTISSKKVMGLAVFEPSPDERSIWRLSLGCQSICVSSVMSLP